jgi:hypothetical protein
MSNAECGMSDERRAMMYAAKCLPLPHSAFRIPHSSPPILKLAAVAT